MNKQSFNPLTPESDWHIISPHRIPLESNIEATRIKEMITINQRRSLLLNKFSMTVLYECKENSRENMHIKFRVYGIKFSWMFSGNEA